MILAVQILSPSSMPPVKCSCFEDKPWCHPLAMSCCKSLPSPTNHIRCKWICILAIAVIVSIAPCHTSTWASFFNADTWGYPFSQPLPATPINQLSDNWATDCDPFTKSARDNQPCDTSATSTFVPWDEDRDDTGWSLVSSLSSSQGTNVEVAEVSSHFLNICTEEVVPMFTFPTPLDDPKLHEGQRCLTVVASVILGGYDDFSFEVPGAWNYHGSKISYASRYGMCWFLFLDWNSSKNIAI